MSLRTPSSALQLCQLDSKYTAVYIKGRNAVYVLTLVYL